jgi:hypothetical protein
LNACNGEKVDVLPIMAICFEPAAALADPIRITSGRLVGDQDGAIWAFVC